MAAIVSALLEENAGVVSYSRTWSLVLASAQFVVENGGLGTMAGTL